MKVSCNIIKDLLPLYAEDMVSEESKNLVDEHLCECDACTKELGALKKVQKVPLEVDTRALNNVKKAINFRRVLAVVTALLLMVTVYCSAFMLLDATIYLTAEQAVESVDVLDDGSIRIHMSNLVIGTGSIGDGGTDTMEPTGNYGIIMKTRLGNLLFPRQRTPYDELPEEFKAVVSKEEYGSHTYQLEGGAISQNFWYCDAKTGMGETLLWDAGNPYPEAPLGDVNYHLAYYCGILAILVVLFKILANTQKKNIVGKIARILDALFSCVLTATLVVSGCQFMELWGEFTENFVDGWILAVPMFATTLCAMKLSDINMKDKAV